jgi:SAM-dependent methyltransferase
MRKWVDWLARDPRGRVKRLWLRLSINPVRTAVQKRRFTGTPGLSPADRELLRRIDSRVHPYEDMYGADYFSVSLSALKCLERALSAANLTAPSAILDMPCGYGRELRAIVARYPEASVTVSDIRPKAVRFCARRFRAEGVVSAKDFNTVHFGRTFDLIWCGTLMTNYDPAQNLALLDLFVRSANEGAAIVFTTHGEYVRQRLLGGMTYGLTPEGVHAVLRGYEETGYGYADYPWETGYGISVISPPRMRELLTRHYPSLREVYFAERDWDNHQDVFGLVKA